MNPHFFTVPFLLCFHLVQGSRFRALVAASPLFLEDGILVSQPCPLGEGAPQGRMGDYGMKDSWDKVSRLLL